EPPERSAVKLQAEESAEVRLIEITDVNDDGEGVGRIDGKAVFVPGTVPGDVARVIVTQERPRFSRARVVELAQASADRCAPPCPVFGECGGCALQHWTYAAQLEWKRRRVQEILRRVGHLDVEVRQTIGASNPWAYRNKSQFPVGREASGEVALGLYRRGSHALVPIERCLIQDPRLDAALAAVGSVLRTHRVRPYDEARHAGFLRHVILRASRCEDAVMVVLVTREEAWPGREGVIRDLAAAVPRLKSVFQNVNPERGNAILGERTLHLWGAPHLVEAVCGVRYLISPRSFFQVNPEQAEALCRTVVRQASAGPHELILDLYCGTGMLSLALAKAARAVHGVEVVADAVRDARANARLNGLQNVQFHVGRAERLIPQWVGEGNGPWRGRPDVIVLDPPRAGCEPALLEAIASAAPRAVVYASCRPATLARDLARLAERGYEVVEVQPIDMFPQTPHVECVARLKRRAAHG
ncbi:MAG TPA: 23S rRNA (uracil(1939)-C(5))-methyltransferase RlmD, partial [Limnochordia bacterium]